MFQEYTDTMSAGPLFVSNEIALSLYCTGSRFACTNCGKEEPLDVDFPDCSNCKAAIYCSRDCQVKDWTQHKKICQVSGDQLQQSYAKMPGRMTRFNRYYSPMVSKILSLQIALMKLEDKSVTTRTNVVTFLLTELPKESKKPKLRLNGVSSMALSDLPEQYRKQIEFGLSQCPPALFVIPYVMQVNFQGGVYMGPGMSAWEASPLLNQNMPKRRDHLTMEMNAWMKTINDVAEGKRADLFRAMKEKMKKNRCS